MSKEMLDLYDAIVNMVNMENLFQEEFQKLEEEHVSFNDVILDRQTNILFPGDAAVLPVLIEGEDDYRWFEVVQRKNGYGLLEVCGKLVHEQNEPYSYDQIIKLNG
jgi:hypothetical protein